MSRSGIPNQLNASLIREVRMIAQQFFQTKRDENFWNSRTPRPQVPTQKCCFCIGLHGKPMDAFTVIRGYAVCPKHAPYVADDKYGSTLDQIRRDERKY